MQCSMLMGRDIYGGGIIIYWRSDLTFQHVKNVPLLSGVEALLIKLRINKTWLMVMGVYKPPKFKFNVEGSAVSLI